MLINLYINDLNKNSKILQDVRFANYLLNLNNFRKTFFNCIFNAKKIEKGIKHFEDFFNQNNCILIPKDISKNNLKFWKLKHLKNPENILKYPNYFDDCVDLIFIKPFDLVSLDKDIAKYFTTPYTGLNKYLLLNNNDSRYFQYEYVTSGIGSTKIKYYNFKNSVYNNILDILKNELIKLYEKDSNLKNYWIYFSLGTTSVSTKGFEVKK